MNRKSRKAIRLSTGAAIAAWMLSTPAAAYARATYAFDIPAQDMGRALRAFGNAARQPVSFDSADTRGKRSAAVRGTYAPDDALRILLEGSGLGFRRSPSGVLVVSPSSGEGEAGGAAADSGSADGQDIVVTGTNIRGIRNRTAPVTILDRDYIESTGQSTAVRLIETLPQNFALASQSAPTSFPGLTGDRSQGAAANLRGIGEGTTLVLLNGRRMALAFDGTAVDLSTLPLSAVERVEVLTDGASALYGSDAVGGVINFVLRRDFQGLETRLRAGWAPGGLNEYRIGQTGGTRWEGGSVVLTGEYYYRDLLETADRDFIPATVRIRSLLPEDENVSLMGAFRQDVTGRLGVFLDGLFTRRQTFNEAGRFTTVFAEDSFSSIDQLTLNGGFDWRIGPAWRVELVGGYGRYDRNSTRGGQIGVAPGDSHVLFETSMVEIKADGPLFAIPGGLVRLAIGGSYRGEEFSLVNRQGATVTNRIVEDQEIGSAYAELNVPIFGPANAVPGLHRLELSLAGRYDDYSKFGGSFDPRIGVAWAPMEGLVLRGSYGTSYVAPRLSDYDTGNLSAAALFSIDPGAPGGVSYQLQVAGGADVASLRPQESRSYTLGAELTPPGLPGLRLALGYYDIEYRDQIATPPGPTVVLANPAAYGSLFVRNPTVAQVQALIALANAGRGFFPFTATFEFDPNFNPASVQLILDARRRNLAVVRTRGLDFSAGYDFSAGRSQFSFGVDGVYIFERTQQVTEASAPFDTIDTIFNPTELRLRGHAGWRHGGWSVNAFVNHVDGYTDNRVAPFVPIDSWTTVDANVSYHFGEERGLLSNVTVTLSAINLFNRDPPTVAVRTPFEIGFDPANASPLGRLVSFEIVKRW